MERIEKLMEQINDSPGSNHAYRIRRAQEAINVLQSFIANEVRIATRVPNGKPGKMTWDEVGQALDVSKSAAFARYGKK